MLIGRLTLSYGSLINLSELYLDSNRIHGLILPEISNLRNLILVLYLNRYQFSGLIPVEITSWKIWFLWFYAITCSMDPSCFLLVIFVLIWVVISNCCKSLFMVNDSIAISVKAEQFRSICNSQSLACITHSKSLYIIPSISLIHQYCCAATSAASLLFYVENLEIVLS